MDCEWRVLKARQFDKNLRKLLKSGIRKDLVDLAVKDLLMWVCREKPLPAKYNLHKLKGNLQGVWDIHLKYDLVLLFKLDEDDKCIYLLNIGSHSEVFN